MFQNRFKKLNAGFTLVELLIAVVIVGVLAAAVSTGYVIYLQNSRCTRLKQDFDAIAKAAEAEYEITGSWAAESSPGASVPELVPSYLPTWPQAGYYAPNFTYDWENWLGNSVNAIAISMRDSNQIIKAYYCVQDYQSGRNNCGGDGNDMPVPLNLGGSCPKGF